MTSPVLFAGGEDIDFSVIGGTFFSASTTGSSFRSGYARQSWVISLGNNTVDVSHYSRGLFAATTSFWVSFRFNYSTLNAAGQVQAAIIPFRLVDVNGVVRLQVKYSGAALSPNDTFVVQSVTSGGVTATLGSTSTGRWGSAISGSGVQGTPDKIDVFCNYGTSGTITVYLNGTQTYTFSGDVTAASGLTALAGFDIGSAIYNTNNGSPSNTYYSECIVATRDTRNMSLVTQAPTANGNTHNWDGGTAANAAATSMATAQASPQFSGSAGQIQEYQVTPAIPTGTFSVISVVQKAQATIGLSGPQHFDFMVRTGATDYTSTPDVAPTSGWATYSYNWDTNPNTAVAWLTTDLPASSTSFNMGLKSVT